MFTLNPTTSTDNAENIHDGNNIMDNKFGGRRESNNNVNTKDYTTQTSTDQDKIYNPIDEVTKDIDDLSDSTARKSEFSYQENKMDTQKGNEAPFIIKSDLENLPSENTDAFEPDPNDPNFKIKRRRPKLKYGFGDGQYDNNPNRGYEGEIR